MLTDLFRLMEQRDIGTITVPMVEGHDPSFRWITRSAGVTRGIAICRRSGAELLPQ